MTLRWRLGLTIAATALVLAGALIWLRSSLDRRTLERGVFDPGFLRGLFAGEPPDGKTWTWQVGLTASFELMLRRLE